MNRPVFRRPDALDLTALCNGLVFFAPVSLLVRTAAGVSMSQFFVLQAVMALVVLAAELPSGRLTDRIGYKATLVLYQLGALAARACLLAAHLRGSWPLFVVQAVLEGAAVSFHSGTQSAYIYSMFPREQYAAKTAHVANFGTLGFFASTLAYAGLYAWAGIPGLLAATLAANLAGVAAALCIPREAAPPARTARPRLRLGRFFRQKRVWAVLLALSALSIGEILVNFFYVEKLRQCQLPETWMTAVILGYSAVQLLAEGILARTGPARAPRLLGLALLLAGGALGVLGAALPPLPTLLAMLVLPLLLDLPSYLLGEAQNAIVDAADAQQDRAALLSAFNMGVNLTEVAFLLGSSVVVQAGPGLCFALLGLTLAAAGAAALCLAGRAARLFPHAGG